MKSLYAKYGESIVANDTGICITNKNTSIEIMPHEVAPIIKVSSADIDDDTSFAADKMANEIQNTIKDTTNGEIT